MTDTPQIKQNANGIWMLEGEQLWDTTILPVCLEHIKEGDTVIDAGAWIGGHTMAYAKKVGEKGKVYAIEPNQHAYDCLWRNTEQLRNVCAYRFALGDKFGDIGFFVKKGWYDSGYVAVDEKIIDMVMIRPLDHYDFAPNFIKIDVEGCELKVLKGAEKTIQKYRPIMVIEVNKPALERQDNTREQVFDWLHANRYSYEPIDNYMAYVYNIICTP